MNNYPDWVVERFGNDVPTWAEERWGDSNNNDDDWYDDYEPNDEEE